MMDTQQPRKRKVVILLLTCIVLVSALIACWFVFGRYVFGLVVIIGALFATLLEYFVAARRKAEKG